MTVPKRERDLLRKYGIGLAEYEAHFIAQGGACGICGTPPSSHKALAVDHCHQTGAVRGLLCHRCNTALGTLGDNPKRLVAVLTYLLNHT